MKGVIILRMNCGWIRRIFMKVFIVKRV